jgi:diaminopimelate decarboxylase
VLKTLASLGAGADVVSEGEMRRALAAGIPANQDRVFRRRQDRARNGLCTLDAGIYCFNVESEPELEAAQCSAPCAKARRRRVLRINPDVDAKTHKKISTGKKENKFGIPPMPTRACRLCPRATLPGIR